jgi:hypothetical protein
MTERFQPGGVTHALVSGLIELALAAALLAWSLVVSESSPEAATSLSAAALIWAVLAVVSLAVAWLRARVLAAELDDEAVTLHGLGRSRRHRYEELSAVEVSGRRTRLVARDGTVQAVRGVRGAAQGNRFRARVLERAKAAAAAAAEGSGGLKERSAGGVRGTPEGCPDGSGVQAQPPVDSLPAGRQPEGSSDG